MPPDHHRMKDYDADAVQLIWEEAISCDAVIDDPYFATDNDDYHNRVNSSKNAISRAKAKTTPLSFNRNAFGNAPYSEQKV